MYKDYIQWTHLAAEAETLWRKAQVSDGREGGPPSVIAAILKRKLSQDSVAIRPRLDTLAEAILEALQCGLNAGTSGAGDKVLGSLRGP